MRHTKENMIPQQLQPLAFPIAELKPDPNNARLHNERNFDLVKKSLAENGWRGVVVARRSDRMILAGHARIAAAKSLGWEQAPVVFVDDDDRKAAAFAIADNRTAELSGWDNAAVKALLEGFEDEERYELGFSLEEFEQLVNPTLPEEWPDDVPATESEAVAPVPKRERVVRRATLLLFTKPEFSLWREAIVKAGIKQPQIAEYLVSSMEALQV